MSATANLMELHELRALDHTRLGILAHPPSSWRILALATYAKTRVLDARRGRRPGPVRPCDSGVALDAWYVRHDSVSVCPLVVMCTPAGAADWLRALAQVGLDPAADAWVVRAGQLPPRRGMVWLLCPAATAAYQQVCTDCGLYMPPRLVVWDTHWVVRGNTLLQAAEYTWLVSPTAGRQEEVRRLAGRSPGTIWQQLASLDSAAFDSLVVQLSVSPRQLAGRVLRRPSGLRPDVHPLDTYGDRMDGIVILRGALPRVVVHDPMDVTHGLPPGPPRGMQRKCWERVCQRGTQCAACQDDVDRSLCVVPCCGAMMCVVCSCRCFAGRGAARTCVLCRRPVKRVHVVSTHRDVEEHRSNDTGVLSNLLTAAKAMVDVHTDNALVVVVSPDQAGVGLMRPCLQAHCGMAVQLAGGVNQRRGILARVHDHAGRCAVLVNHVWEAGALLEHERLVGVVMEGTASQQVELGLAARHLVAPAYILEMQWEQ
jgi:hypothetical protein